MIFISVQEAIDYHGEVVSLYGGANGLRDLGLLTSAIEMAKAAMFGEDLHPTIFDKAAAYLFHIVCNHPFLDGNKRTGTIVALTFLRANQIIIKFTDKQLDELEELVVSCATGNATKVEIASFFHSCYTAP